MSEVELREEHLPAFRKWLMESCIPWQDGNAECEAIRVKRLGKFAVIGRVDGRLQVPPALESTVRKFLADPR